MTSTTTPLTPALAGPRLGSDAHPQIVLPAVVLDAAERRPSTFTPEVRAGDPVMILATLAGPLSVTCLAGTIGAVSWADRWDQPTAHITWPTPGRRRARMGALCRAWATVHHAETSPAPKYGQAVIVLDDIDGYRGQLAFVTPPPEHAAPTGPFVRLATGPLDVAGARLAVTRWAVLATHPFLGRRR